LLSVCLTLLAVAFKMKSVSYFALTFDDGPGPTTPLILDVLRKYKVKATFFILGQNVQEPQWCDNDSKYAMSLVVRALREGHVVGNHTYSHPARATPIQFIKEIENCDSIINMARQKAGFPIKKPIPFRLPYGLFIMNQHRRPNLDPRFLALASLGRTHTHWTSLFGDWDLKKHQDGKVLFRRMLRHVSAQSKMRFPSVLALHDSSEYRGDTTDYQRTATSEGLDLFLAHSKKKMWKHFVVPR
jgi:peptidoglycan/xylan/chitin deacetylase (PgdA/CDA1 family)